MPISVSDVCEAMNRLLREQQVSEWHGLDELKVIMQECYDLGYKEYQCDREHVDEL